MLRPASRDQQFALDRFSRLLNRRLQVEVAIKQIPATAESQTWLIRALDGTIADELRQLDRFGLADEAQRQLQTFRQALNWVRSGGNQAA
jgi:hypothetical protein